MALASKVQPPSLPTGCVPRPGLEARLAESCAYRLTTVVAGAGFGKSTLLAAWTSVTNAAWYTLDSSDASPVVLGTGLVEAIRRRVPALPADLAPADHPSSHSAADQERRAEALASYLAESIRDQLTSDLVLVLDDLQEIGRRGPATRLIEALCRQAPPTLHLVLSSREEPPFALQRMRSSNQVMSLEASDLAFSRDELESVLRESLGPRGAGLAQRLHERTSGWPAAARLAVEALRGVELQKEEAVLAGFAEHARTLFDYLAEEVFQREPPAVRTLLRRVAPFDRFTVEMCEALGVHGANQALARLLQRSLFLKSEGARGRYVLHELIREFVRSAWPLTDAERRDVHGRAAAWYEQEGLIPEALDALATAGDTQAISRLLSERGLELVRSGSSERVIELAKILPPDLRDSRIEEIVGEAHMSQEEHAEAQRCFRRAAPESGPVAAGLAWRMGRVHMAVGEYDRALEAYARGTIDGSGSSEESLLLTATAWAYLMQGDAGAGRRLAREALEAAVASQDPRALGVAHGLAMTCAMGEDPTLVDEHYRAAIEATAQAGDVKTGLAVRANRTAHLIEEGAYGQALEEIEAVLRGLELAGLAQAPAHVLNNRGEARLRLGRLDEALADFDASASIYRRSGSSKRCWPLANQGRLYRERGDLATARSVSEEALALAERWGNVQGRCMALSNLALLTAPEDPDEAARLASQAVSLTVAPWGYLRLDALIGQGWVALAGDDRSEAAGLARTVEAEAGERRNREAAASALELQALAAPDPAREIARLDTAIKLWREIGNPLAEARAELALARLSGDPTSRSRAAAARRRLEALGVRPDAAAGAAGILHALPREAPPALAIRTLGGFQVLREGRPVPLSEWRSKQARDLLKILIARRGRPVPRQSLTGLLWPGQAPEALPNRLSVVLTGLRAVLDPGRRFPLDYFIAGDDAGLRLDTTHVALDVESFLAQAPQGLALERAGRSAEDREALAAAEASYTGDFLEANLYDDWATSLREEARARYVALARKLARTAADLGEAEAAVRYLLRVLEREPYDEEANLELVGVLVRAGRHGEARRAYRTYVGRMEDLGVEPALFPAPA